MIPLEAVAGLSAVLFAIGLYGVLARRNAVLILLAVEVMLNAVALNFVAFGAYRGDVTGQVVAIFVICVAAAEVGLALGILLRLHRNRQTVDVDRLDELKW